jgi:hypothetical protein
MIPVTNSGTTASESPPTVMSRSVSRSRFRAATTPPTNASTASLAEWARAGPISSLTGRL